MKCPHCLENFNTEVRDTSLFGGYRDNEQTIYLTRTLTCTNEKCEKRIIYLVTKSLSSNPGGGATTFTKERLIYPVSVSRPNIVTSDIPEKLYEDYSEACNVLSMSPKASAAISRRLLQTILVQQAKVKKKDLFDQIGEVIEDKSFPSRISSLLDGVRVIGNFASHPLKSTHTGEIIDIEPGEAEINLEAIEMLFDFYFTQERIAKERKDIINKKLADAGKPSLEEALKQRKKKKNKDS